MKKILAILLTAVMSLSIVACGGGGTKETTAEDTGEVTDTQETTAEAVESKDDSSSDDKTIVIGITNMTLKEAVYKIMEENAQAKAAEMGNVEVNWVSSENDPTLQANQVDNFIASGIDVLILEPARSDAAKDMVNKAQAAGIPVVNLEAAITGATCDYRIAGNTQLIGEMQVDDYVEREGADVSGKVVILSGSKGDEAAETITKGNLEQLEKAAPNLEVVVQLFHENWDRQLAMNTMENALTQYGDDIVAVFANNDTMAIGAMQAAKNVGKDQDIMFYGSDFDKDSAEMLLDGATNYAVIDRGAIEIGVAIVEQGVKLARGEEAEVSEVVDDVPTYWVPLKMITSDNISELGKAKYPDLIK